MAPHAAADEEHLAAPNGTVTSSTMGELPIFSVTKLTDERTKILGECLHANHEMFAVLRDPYLIFHNHMPHILGSAYYLGANPSQMHAIAKNEGESLRPHNAIPAVQETITRGNWRQFLNSKAHTLEFQKFFDGEIERAEREGRGWKSVVEEFLFEGEQPIANGLCGGLGHPFIHFAYAYEFDSRDVASESLSMTCTEYDMMHPYLDQPPADTSTYKTRSFDEILSRVRDDPRFAGHFNEPGFMNSFTIHFTCEAAFLEHWNALEVSGPGNGIEDRFEELFDVSVRLAIETGDRETQFDFFLIHILTVAHGIRILLPTLFPRDKWESIYRQFWLWTLLMYIAQLRRPIVTGSSDKFDLKGRDWKWVSEQALTDKWSLDAHYVKVVRALKVGAEVHGEKGGWYLKACVRFMEEFEGWVGFGRGVEDYPGAH